MWKIMKVAQMAQMVTLLLLVVAVSNTGALPSSPSTFPVPLELPCNPAELEVLWSSFTSWISALVSQGYDPAAVAGSIFISCDANKDSALNQTELANCVQSELADSISDSCFTLLLEDLDLNDDDAVNMAELTALIVSVSGQGRGQRRWMDGFLSRDASNRDSSDGSDSKSREDVMRHDHTDSPESSESSGDDSDSKSREDVMRHDHTDSPESSESSGDDSDSKSSEDVMRHDHTDSPESRESSGDDSDSKSREDVMRHDHTDSPESSESSGDDSDCL